MRVGLTICLTLSKTDDETRTITWELSRNNRVSAKKVVANAKFGPDQIARNPWEDRLKYNRGDIQLSVT